MKAPKQSPAVDAAWDPTVCRRRCVRIKKDGERCKKRPVLGTTVCGSHGAGKGSPVRASADAKVAAAKLDCALAEYWDAESGVVPAESYQYALEVSSGNVRALRQLVQDGELTADKLVFAHRVAMDGAKVAMDGVKAGIADRAVTLAEGQGRLLAEAFGKIITAPVLGLSPEQRIVAVGLLRAQMEGPA